MNGKQRGGRNLHGVGNLWHIGRHGQRRRIDAKEKMMHGSITDNTGESDHRKRDTGFGGCFCGKACEDMCNAVLEL